METVRIGYARCSTDRQDLTAQRCTLVELGVPPLRPTAHRLRPETIVSTETFAVALVGDDPDHGWIVEADGATAAVDHVHTTDPRARKCLRSELLVFTTDRYRERHLAGADFPAGWVRLGAPGPKALDPLPECHPEDRT